MANTFSDFKGAAKRLEDIDLPRIGAEIGVGEDVLHALIEVETSGSGFDNQGRPKMLFEPHKFYKYLSGAKRAEAVEQGLAYPKWGTQKYPKDSYPRLEKAMEIDSKAALMSASWGLGQIMGENYRMAGYSSVGEMVDAFKEDEESHLEAMVRFIKASGIDDDLRRIQEKVDAGEKVTASDWVPVVRVYNGAGFAANDYHNRAARALNKWLKIKDTDLGSPDIRKTAEVEASDAAKGVTAGNDNSEHMEGTPPPAEAVEVKASRPSLKSTAVAVFTFLMAPLSYLGIDAKQVGEFAKGNLTLAIKVGAGLALVIIAAWIWNRAQDRAQQRTSALMQAAMSPDKMNLRLVGSSKQPYKPGDWAKASISEKPRVLGAWINS